MPHKRLVVSLSDKQQAFQADRPISAALIRQLLRQYFASRGEIFPPDAPVGVRRNHKNEDED